PQLRQQRHRLVHRHAELVDLQPGRDVRVAPRVDVRVEADRDPRHAIEPLRDRFDTRQLAGGLDVDRLHAERDGAFELRRRLADAGEHDLRRVVSGSTRGLDLPHRVGVDAAAERAQQPGDRQRRVRLQRVVQRVRVAVERLVDRAVAIANRRCAVDVDRRADRRGDLGERHSVADEVVVPARVPGRQGGRWQRDTLFYSTYMTPESGDAVEGLIQRCLQGDQVAWEQIVRQYWRKVFNVAYKFVGKHDEAEDLTQDIFLKIFKSLDTFDRRANFQTWLISISRNLCIDHYRSVRKERETIDRDVDANDLSPLSHDPGPVAALEQQDRVQLLKQAMAALPETLRTAVLLRDIQEFS